jgi:Tfp pilus assembly protein PilN
VKRRKHHNIGIVIADDTIRAAQQVDGRLVLGSVPTGENLKKCLRQLLSSAPFVGRDVVVGFEGSAVLIESIVLPAGGAKEARKICADRLKGDPLFSAEKAILGVVVEGTAGSEGPGSQGFAIMAAVDKDRLAGVMKACREIELEVNAVEAAALASWRAWTSESLNVRLVRSSGHDIVLAGNGEKLLFCRIVEAPMSTPDLRATVGRAASLLGAEAFDSLAAVGLDEEEREDISEGLKMPVKEPACDVDDAVAMGLATEGTVLADFTPPEERILREKRRMRKVSLAMSGACAVLVLAVGVLRLQHLGGLEDRKLQLEQRYDIVQADKQQLAVLEEQLTRQGLNEAVIARAQPGHRMSTLFRLLASHAGDDVALETVKINDIENPAFDPPEGYVGPIARQLEVRVNGLARNSLSVREFADGLLASGAFEDVRLEASERVLLGIGVDGERFRIYTRAETH